VPRLLEERALVPNLGPIIQIRKLTLLIWVMVGF